VALLGWSAIIHWRSITGTDVSRQGLEAPTGAGLGSDIGGSVIKPGLGDLDTGVLVGARKIVASPYPSTPAAVGEAVAELVAEFAWGGSVGVGLPGGLPPRVASLRIGT
jgi:predicted NBD/HSP70 family sugar kinase